MMKTSTKCWGSEGGYGSRGEGRRATGLSSGEALSAHTGEGEGVTRTSSLFLSVSHKGLASDQKRRTSASVSCTTPHPPLSTPRPYSPPSLSRARTTLRPRCNCKMYAEAESSTACRPEGPSLAPDATWAEVSGRSSPGEVQQAGTLIGSPLALSASRPTSSLRDREMERSFMPMRCLHRAGSRSCAGTLCPRPAWTSGPPNNARPPFSLPCKPHSSKKQTNSNAEQRMERSGSTERRDSIGSSDGTGGDGKGGGGGGVSGEKHQRSVSPTLCLSLFLSRWLTFGNALFHPTRTTLGCIWGSVASRWPVCRVGGRRPSARARLRPASSARARTSCASGRQAGSASGRGMRCSRRPLLLLLLDLAEEEEERAAARPGGTGRRTTPVGDSRRLRRGQQQDSTLDGRWTLVRCSSRWARCRRRRRWTSRALACRSGRW